MKLTITPQAIRDVLVIEHERLGDARGFFAEIYRDDFFDQHGIGGYVQDNLSRSSRGVLRGLHFQKPPAAIAKLVRCARGRIYDVAVDIRKSSPTFGKFVGVELDENENRMLYVPVGFAHGFCVLSDVAEVHYKVTGYFSAPHDCGIRWNDPQVAVPWPVREPTLSPRDQRSPFLSESPDLFA